MILYHRQNHRKVDTAYSKAKELLKANSELAGFTGAASVDILGEAQAVEELGLIDKVSIVGVGTQMQQESMSKMVR